MRRLLLVGLLLVPFVPPAAAVEPPVPEVQFAGTVLPRPCVPEADNPYEAEQHQLEGWEAPDLARYPGHCQRLRFTFGPIAVKPGQNDVLIEPITIQKPAYDGYIVRFRPDLVRADGSVPAIEDVHLHHATWLSLFDDYGTSGKPFFAAGEEKTIGHLPRGYGMPVFATDRWQLLYMIHKQTSEPDLVWIVYELDVIPKADAEDLDLRPAYPIWLDVVNTSYPVFNTQRGYGTDGRCTWPRENCAAFDPYGRVTPNQGAPTTTIQGKDFRLPNAGGSLGRIRNFQGGTLVGIAGHLHPGGLADEVDLVRDGLGARRVFSSEAVYWDHDDPSVPGGPPNSWDLSMTAATLPRWAVRVEPRDILRVNAVYDSTLASTYENMGIVVAFLAPDDDSGLDPFDDTVGFDPVSTDPDDCWRARVVCERGVVTHGHMQEAANKGGPNPDADPWTVPGPQVTRFHLAGFSYLPEGVEDFGGTPVVPYGSRVTFVNEDMGANVYHSITSCAYPCSGTTGIAYPVSDGTSRGGGRVDFDSGQLGYSPDFGPAKNTLTWTLDVDESNGFEQGDTYTFFCRVHPMMRGAFKVG